MSLSCHIHWLTQHVTQEMIRFKKKKKKRIWVEEATGSRSKQDPEEEENKEIQLQVTVSPHLIKSPLIRSNHAAWTDRSSVTHRCVEHSSFLLQTEQPARLFIVFTVWLFYGRQSHKSITQIIFLLQPGFDETTVCWFTGDEATCDDMGLVWSSVYASFHGPSSAPTEWMKAPIKAAVVWKTVIRILRRVIRQLHRSIKILTDT